MTPCPICDFHFCYKNSGLFLWVMSEKTYIFVGFCQISSLRSLNWGGQGGHLSPIRSVNPISIGEGRLSPPITTGTPNVFHLPASLLLINMQICNFLTKGLTTKTTTKLCLGLGEQSSQSKICKFDEDGGLYVAMGYENLSLCSTLTILLSAPYVGRNWQYKASTAVLA